MINRLYFFANIGNRNKLPIGGGQTSARRVIEGFTHMGLKIIEIDRHWNVMTSKLGHLLENYFFALVNTIHLTIVLLFGKRKNSAMFHISYSASLLPLEFITGIIARVLGYKTILYLKGGKLEDTITNLKGIKKWIFKKNLNIRSLVLFEGESDIAKVKPYTHTKLVYFPNYIFEKDIPKTLFPKPSEYIGICYFGRITEDKNVHVVLDVFELLANKYPKLKLFIIGGLSGKGGSKKYYNNIVQRCEQSVFTDRIERWGQSSQTVINEMLDKCHFFLFPSADPCEGQSNSLNEAMTRGCVPIVSDFHFNASIVANKKLIVKGYNPQDYSIRIAKIIDEGIWEKLSVKMWKRIRNVYSYKCVNERIYNEIINI